MERNRPIQMLQDNVSDIKERDEHIGESGSWIE